MTSGRRARAQRQAAGKRRPPPRKVQAAAVRRQRRWWAGAAGLAVIGMAVGLSGQSAPPAHLDLAPAGSLGHLVPAPPPGPLGPERVPVPNTPPLATTASDATGQAVDGISCNTSEQLVFHVHTHLTIFVDGAARQIPYGIGIDRPAPSSTPLKAPSSPQAAAFTGCTSTPKTASSTSSHPCDALTPWATSSPSGASPSEETRSARSGGR